MENELKKEATAMTSISSLEDIETNVKYDIDGFIKTRQEFIEKVNAIMVEGSDYHIIKTKKQENGQWIEVAKKSLAKGGAEKIASIFQLVATFQKDEDAMEAFSSLKEAGIICFVCTLTKNNIMVGEGRGAAALAKNNGDPNKTLKMAQKSAFIDAVLRASGLSDFFTQDLEDMQQEHISKPTSSNATYSKPSIDRPMTEPQKWKVKALMTEKGITSKEVEDFNGGKLTTSLQASKAIEWMINKDSSLPVIQENEELYNSVTY